MSEITCPQCHTAFTPESAEEAAIAEIDRAIKELELAKAKLIKFGAQVDPEEDDDEEEDEVEDSVLRTKLLKTLDFLGLVEDKNEVKSSGSLRKFANSLGLVDLEPAK